MGQRKYISEFGLNMLNGARLVLQQEHLHKINEINIKPHIYIIARRPRITILPSEFKFGDEIIKGVFRKQVREDYEDIEVSTNNHLGTSEVEIISDYPFTEYRIVSSDGDSLLANGKSALLLAACGVEYWHHLDLEVLYIGQSYGLNGSRTAAERLQKHETLQGIYAEAMRNSPDQDIWLFVSEFEEMFLATFDGRDRGSLSSSDDDSHISRVVNNTMSQQQKINFTEAALIRYFNPEYNKTYRDTFPNPAHRTYSECYDIDLNMICVEIQTRELGFRFWSKAVDSAWVHFCAFPLHSKEDRRYMFEIDGKDIL